MLQSFKNSKKAFTLVEMLIVVTIIGILSAALIPRLQGAQAGARDAARQSDLRQISSATQMYYNDRGHFPEHEWSVWDNALTWLIKMGYIDSLPTDPQANRPNTNVLTNWDTPGTYGYSGVINRGTPNGGSIVVANIERSWGTANWTWVNVGNGTNKAGNPIDNNLEYIIEGFVDEVWLDDELWWWITTDENIVEVDEDAKINLIVPAS